MDWQSLFPQLSAADVATRQVMDAAGLVELPGGQPVFHAGSACESYVLVVSGQIRVQVIGEGGREAVLYRVLPGQSCVLTTCCILAGEDYPAEGYAEGPVRALVFSKPQFDQALDTAPAFRRFVFQNLGRRLTEIVARMEEVAFWPVDRRLAGMLLDHADQTGRVNATHQAVAVELGSAREVVSRLLKRLESAGLVRLGRSSIQVVDRPGLQRLAGRRVT